MPSSRANLTFSTLLVQRRSLQLLTFVALLTPAVGRALPQAVGQGAVTAKPAAAGPPATPALAAPPPPVSLGTAAAKNADPATAAIWTLSDRRPHVRAQALSLSVGVWPPTTLSGALWYAIPLVPDGFLRPVNDSFDIEFGAVVAGFFDGPDHGAIIPAVGGRWNFHLTHDWTPFASLKLAARFGFGPLSPDRFDMGVSLGSLLRLQDGIALRLELGYPTGLSVGLSFRIGV